MKLPVDPVLGPSTLNIGTIKGGRAPNVIPDEARAELFIRLVGDSTSTKADIIKAAGTAVEINELLAIVDAFVTNMTKSSTLTEQAIRDAVKQAVLALNALNKRCNGNLIETDQREDICELILVAAAQAGLHTDEDITEEWREW